jgi:hypothetical protein
VNKSRSLNDIPNARRTLSRRLWTRGSLGVALAACALLLFFGNPQWCRVIYMFQAYVLGRGQERVWGGPGDDADLVGLVFLLPPDDYTGVWRVWDRSGRKRGEYPLRDGKDHGVGREWYANGQLKFEDWRRTGSATLQRVEWYPDGRLRSAERWAKGSQDGLGVTWDRRGRVESWEHWEKNRRVTRLNGPTTEAGRSSGSEEGR